MEKMNEAQIITSSSLGVNVDALSSCTQYLPAQIESIEDSKVHWSILAESEFDTSEDQKIASERDTGLSDEQIIAENIEEFKSLQLHPEWGNFFITINKEQAVTLLVGDKFAEGGQAEIFNVSIDALDILQGEKKGQWVLKMFKKGTELQHLRLQWPLGYLQWKQNVENEFLSCVARVERGVLLPNGQFTFLIRKEVEDLRRLIVRGKPNSGYACGPFPKEIIEEFLYDIACGMDWLHKRNIIHRDLKASNVLVSCNICYVADYECSNGVIGTGFWRDPQILQACKERNCSRRPELFTRAVDVYSYGMTCYEILTGKLPFEGENMAIECVIEGQRPKVPDCVDYWIKDLMYKCWETSRDARPTFEEILNIIVANMTCSWIKSRHELDMKINNQESKPLLGCNNRSHDLEMMECSPYESGVYMCKLCLKQGNGGHYHCSSCGDFDLHPGCATIPVGIKSFLHTHVLYLRPGFFQNGRGIICDGCQLEILEGNYYNSYKCHEEECDFDLHIHCAKYARAIIHHLHEEHELVLMYSSTSMEGGESSQICNGCNIELDPVEIVYCCRQCGFNIHPHCIIARLECKSW